MGVSHKDAVMPEEEFFVQFYHIPSSFLNEWSVRVSQFNWCLTPTGKNGLAYSRDGYATFCQRTNSH